MGCMHARAFDDIDTEAERSRLLREIRTAHDFMEVMAADVADAEVMPLLNALENLGQHAQRKLTGVIHESARQQWEQALDASGNPCDAARGSSVAGHMSLAWLNAMSSLGNSCPVFRFTNEEFQVGKWH